QTGIKKTGHPPTQGDGNPPKRVAKNNKQKPPNTLLSSQTTDLIVLKFPFPGNPASLNYLGWGVKLLCSPCPGQLD
ncbi:hypothetical protein, partial [Mycolicibacterium sp. P9-22]|uniref:hypothetical protein n=1 Tax=Mycolicibacterium sp. P9-22 TaxID=2024613 RepID=UPI001D15386A